MCDSGKAIVKLVRCIKITRPDLDNGRNYCICRIEAFHVGDEFEGAEPGDKVTLEYCEIDQAELDALPEFEGW